MHRNVLAQTPTPTLTLAFRACGMELRTQDMCAHTCTCTPPQGCVIPGIQLQAACLCGPSVSRHSFVPTAVPLGSAPQGSATGGQHVLGPVMVLKGNLQIIVFEPSQNKLGNERGLPCSEPLLPAKTCALAFAQACSPVVPRAPGLPCHHL